MASWEEVACCEPVITPIRESASALADLIFSERDAETLWIVRGRLLLAIAARFSRRVVARDLLRDDYLAAVRQADRRRLGVA